MPSTAALASPPSPPGPPAPWDALEAREPPWAVLHAALAEAGGGGLPGNRVRGHAIGYRTRNGALEPERCLVAFVPRKRTPAELDARDELPIPGRIQVGEHSIPVDVVETGRIRRNGHCGFRMGMKGVGNGDRWGTLGMVARDRATGAPLAITSMHLSSSKQPVPPTVLPDRWKAVLELGAAPVVLGPVRRGTMQGVDAAGISFGPSVAIAPFLPGVGWLRGARAPTDADRLQPVQMFGAKSRYQSGTIAMLNASFPSLGLKDAFLVRMKCAAGDSGAVCCTLKGEVLGLHVATLTADPKLQLFCPIDAVLDALDCTFQ